MFSEPNSSLVVELILSFFLSKTISLSPSLPLGYKDMTQNFIATDEFSFPTVNDPASNFPSSPSLWRVPSEDPLGAYLQYEGGENTKKTGIEEKMDMLWENFNDDLHYKKEVESFLDSEDMVELCCVQALKLSKSSSTMLSPRKPGLLVILKVLKKLFLLQNSHCPKRASSSPRE